VEGIPVKYELVDGSYTEILSLSPNQLILEKISAYKNRKFVSDIYDIYHLSGVTINSERKLHAFRQELAMKRTKPNRQYPMSINMMKALKVRLYPNESQKILLEKHFGASRFVWNHFLQKRTEYYAESKKHGSAQGLNYFKTCKMLTELKKEKDWLYEVSNPSLQQTLRKLDNAFTAFFRKNSDYPNFRSKKGNQYFVIPENARAEGRKLIIPKFMEGIEIKDKHEMPESIKQVVVTREVERYYASIYYESDEIL